MSMEFSLHLKYTSVIKKNQKGSYSIHVSGSENTK